MNSNPFCIGDKVVYTPSLRGRGYLVMTDLSALELGCIYEIVELEDKDFLVLRGFEKCLPRSIHWTEFQATVEE